RQSREQVAKLQETWGAWSELLAAHDVKTLLEGTYGAAMARQVLRKVLVGPIVVTPVRRPSRPIDLYELHVGLIKGTPAPDISWTSHWTFKGFSRFDTALRGGLTKGE